MHLTDDKGKQVFTQQAIMSCIKGHLSEVYQNLDPPEEEDMIKYLQMLTFLKLRSDRAAELEVDLTLEELQTATNLLPNKALGSNGFLGEFIKTYSPKLTQYLLQVFLEAR